MERFPFRLERVNARITRTSCARKEILDGQHHYHRSGRAEKKESKRAAMLYMSLP
jgi:hypothetical protein